MEYYNKEKHILDKNQDVLIHILDKYIKNIKGKTILDVGCGFGGLGNAVKKKDANFVGIDICNDVYIAKKLSSEQIELIKGDGHSIPFRSNTFDVVVSIGTLEHIKEPESFIIEMTRVLKPNGIIFLFYGPNRRFHWLDNRNHKKIVCTYLTPEDVYKIIEPSISKINLVWKDIIKYRLCNGYIPKAFNKSVYHKYLKFIFDMFGKNKIAIESIYMFCGVLEKISVQPNIALVGQKRVFENGEH